MSLIRQSIIALAAVLAACATVTGVPGDLRPSAETGFFGDYKVLSINGSRPGAPADRERNALKISDEGITVALGCTSVTLSGTFSDGVFVVNDNLPGGLFLGSGNCTTPEDERLEDAIALGLTNGSGSAFWSDDYFVIEVGAQRVVAVPSG